MLCALLFSLFSSSVAAWEGGASKFSQGGAVYGGYVPESQTLIVPVLSPEMTLVPSGETSTPKTEEPVLADPTSFRVADTM